METESLMSKESLENTFACNVFSDVAMRARLPKNIYKTLRKTIDEGLPLAPEVADIVANAMKDWAIEKGATHFTHWFQPMTGMTAENMIPSFLQQAMAVLLWSFPVRS